jgi:hypothetical protein
LAPPAILWELRGRTGTPVTCFLYPKVGDAVRLTVRMGDKVIVSDDHFRETDALAQADFLFDDFLKDGWTEQYRRDPRSA